MLILAALPAGILTALTGRVMSVLTRVFAEDDECEDDGNNNCNENEDGSDSNSNSGNGEGDITCWKFAQNPQDGDSIVDEFPPGRP